MATKNILSYSKDLLAILRDGLIFVGLVIFGITFICWPKEIKEHFHNAGISKIGDIELSEAGGVIDTIKRGLNESNQILSARLSSDSAFLDSLMQRHPNLKMEINNALLQISAAQTNANTSQKQVNTLIASRPELRQAIEDAQEKVNGSGNWGVVFGADGQFESAKYEVKVAADLGVKNASVYSRNKSYRSVALFDNRDDAEKAATILRGRHPDAYIVPMSTWCKHVGDSSGYKTCALQ